MQHQCSNEKAARQHLADNAASVRAICPEGHRAHLYTLHKCMKLRHVNTSFRFESQFDMVPLQTYR